MKGHTYTKAKKPTFENSALCIVDAFLHQLPSSFVGVKVPHLSRKIRKTRPRGETAKRMMELGFRE